MITPINFSGLHYDRMGNVDAIKRITKNPEACESYKMACAEIDKLSGSEDVFIKADYPDEKKKNVATLTITDKDDLKIAKVTIPTTEYTPTLIKMSLDKLVNQFRIFI